MIALLNELLPIYASVFCCSVLITYVVMSTRNQHLLPLAGAMLQLFYIYLDNYLISTGIMGHEMHSYFNMISQSAYVWVVPMFYIFLQCVTQGEKLVFKDIIKRFYLPVIWSVVYVALVLCTPINSYELLIKYGIGIFRVIKIDVHIAILIGFIVVEMLIVLWQVFRLVSFLRIFSSRYTRNSKNYYSHIKSALTSNIYGVLVCMILFSIMSPLEGIFLLTGVIMQHDGFVIAILLLLTTVFAIHSVPLNFDSYKRIALSDERITYIAQKMHYAFYDMKVYTNKDLTIDSLAAQIDVSANEICIYLNVELGKYFYFYVNEIRLRVAGQIVRAHPNVSYDELLPQCGFPDKGVFRHVLRHMYRATLNEFKTEYKRSAK